MGASNFKTYQGVVDRNESFDRGNDFRFLIEGGSGNDYAFTSFNDDLLYGQGGRDLLRGDAGNDQLFGDYSVDDSANPGGGADDLIVAGTGDDIGYGSVGDDFLCGEDGADVLYGGTGNDLVYGGSGSDRIHGDDGNDILYGASEASIRTGFWAAITLDFDGVTDTALSKPRVASAAGGYIEVSYGDTTPDVIDGGAGNDSLFGSLGPDTMTGGTGNDVFTVDNAGDRVVEVANEGTDGVRASVTHTLAANVETLTLTGSAAIAGSGNAANNTLTGNSGANLLTGFAGADQLLGGGGADKFLFRTLAESTVASAGRDFIRDFSHAQGDRIDLHYIDAKTTVSGDQAFAFIGAAAFGHHAGELRAVTSGTTTIVSGDVNGDAAADFSILVNKTTFVAGDFLL